MSVAVDDRSHTLDAKDGFHSLIMPLMTEHTLRVIRRTGETIAYDPQRIVAALTKAFLNCEGNKASESQRVHDVTINLTNQVTETLLERWPEGGSIHIEDIQNQVEIALMRSNQTEVARHYILYREERARARAKEGKAQTRKVFHMTLPNNQLMRITPKEIAKVVKLAAKDLKNIDAEHVAEETFQNIFDGISQAELNKALTITARTYIENDPDYDFLAANLLRLSLFEECLGHLNIPFKLFDFSTHETAYRQALKASFTHGIHIKRLTPKLTELFNVDKLAAAIDPARDYQFRYLGLQTLYDRYLIHDQGTRIELPQVFLMRVAAGLAINEDDPTARAIEFYNLLSSLDYMSSTPTLFNSGTLRPQLSSCFLTTVPDDLKGIFESYSDVAMLSKYAGGLGCDWTPVRGIGSHIHGTNGQSSGTVPFLSVLNNVAIAVNQGGKRKGAVCSYLETWHMDIEEFLELRKNTGDERRRTHDMNTANWIPDLFMERMLNKQQWTLFSPSDVPDLHDLYGEDFKKAYEAYEAKAEQGLLRHRKVEALTLWRKMLSMVFETGHPWLIFKDPCNVRSPQQHVGVVHSSNLCTEITLNTSDTEIAVCNLGSLNLVNHITKDGLDEAKLAKSVKTAVRMLDNVIDVCYYTVDKARHANQKHRPVGLGLMGTQDALQIMGIPYASDEAMTFADQSMEAISYYAIEASMELAKERGSYESFKGSLWDQGILPIDSAKNLKKLRGENFSQNLDSTKDWNSLREKVVSNGMRNSNVMAIAPTATISNICGVSQSIEPTYQNLFVKSNMSGEFTVVNHLLVDALKKLDLWDEVMINDLKYFDGSIQNIDRIPQELKTLYATSFEVDPKWLIEAGSRRQKWIDQAQSLNLYMEKPSGKKLHDMYLNAWLKGLKSTYYLRSLGATRAEKSTIHDGALNAVSATKVGAVCNINDPDCEACQ